MLHPRTREVAGRLQRQRAVQRHHNDEAVAQEALPGGRVDQAGLRQIVHLGLIRREKEIGGRALLDLPRERARSREIQAHDVAGGLLVFGREFLQCGGKAGRGKDIHFRRPRGDGRGQHGEKRGR